MLALASAFVLYDHSQRKKSVRLLSRVFEENLKRDDCSPRALDQAESLLGVLAGVDSEQADHFRRLWYQHVEAVVRTAVKADRFSAAEAERITATLRGLAVYQPELKAVLERVLQDRLGAWTTALELSAPFAQLDQAFAADRVRQEQGPFPSLLPRHPSRLGQGDLTPTLAVCEGDVRLETVWSAPSWGLVPQVGVGLHDTQGHAESLRWVTFTRDGKFLISGGPTGWIKWWSTATGRHAGSLRGHTSGVTSLAVSPDGEVLASASRDQSVRLWSVASRKPIHQLTGHKGDVLAVVFSPDGALTASAGSDRTVRVWNSRTGEPVAVLTGHEKPATHLVFSRDGTELVSCDDTGAVRVWDVMSGKRKESFPDHPFPVNKLALSPDGKTLATACADAARLWDFNARKERGRLEVRVGVVACVAFSPDGQLLATGTDQGELWLWDWRSGGKRASLTGHQGTVFHAVFDADGKTLASVGKDGGIHLWEVATGQERMVVRQQSYRFLVGIPKEISQPLAARTGSSGALASLAGAIREKGEVRLRILRNEGVLVDETVKVPPGFAEAPLQLTATAEAGRLTFQVNDLTPLTFQDAFPLPQSVGFFSLYWPAEVRLTRLRRPPGVVVGPGRPGERGHVLCPGPVAGGAGLLRSRAGQSGSPVQGGPVPARPERTRRSGRRSLETSRGGGRDALADHGGVASLAVAVAAKKP